MVRGLPGPSSVHSSGDAPVSQKPLDLGNDTARLVALSPQTVLSPRTDPRLPLSVWFSSILRRPGSAGMQPCHSHPGSTAGAGSSAWFLSRLKWEGCTWPPAPGASQPVARDHCQAGSWSVPGQGYQGPGWMAPGDGSSSTPCSPRARAHRRGRAQARPAAPTLRRAGREPNPPLPPACLHGARIPTAAVQ